MRARTLIAIALTAGCGGGNDDGSSAEAGETGGFGEAMPLLDNDAWAPMAEAVDPLAAHRPETIDCSIAGVIIEDGVDGLPELEMNTGECNYFALEQPSLAPIEVGDQIYLEIYHFDLTSPVQAESHVALLVGDDIVWERTIAIEPGLAGAAPAEFFDERWVSQIAAPVGTRIGVHLHNHGQNTWNLVEMSVEPAIAPD